VYELAENLRVPECGIDVSVRVAVSGAARPVGARRARGRAAAADAAQEVPDAPVPPVLGAGPATRGAHPLPPLPHAATALPRRMLRRVPRSQSRPVEEDRADQEAAELGRATGDSDWATADVQQHYFPTASINAVGYYCRKDDLY
jgi:hypothetical protein